MELIPDPWNRPTPVARITARGFKRSILVKGDPIKSGVRGNRLDDQQGNQDAGRCVRVCWSQESNFTQMDESLRLGRDVTNRAKAVISDGSETVGCLQQLLSSTAALHFNRREASPLSLFSP